MTVYNFILAFLSGCLMIFALYYLFATIFIHKKIYDKHFYFVLAAFFSSLYVFFQLLLSLDFTPEQYLIFHKLKLISHMIWASIWMLTVYESYLPGVNKLIPKTLLLLVPLFIILTPFDIFISMPINKITYSTFFSTFIYRFGKTNIIYSIWSIFLMSTALISFIIYFFTKPEKRKKPYIFILVSAILMGCNDFLVTHRIIDSFMVAEYFLFIVLSFIFFDFLMEDRKTYLKVIELSKESIRRLRITEIYTRKSLVESIEKGEDPTKFQPNNIQIATLFTDIRDFTGISEGLQPLEVVELLNSYFNRMNSTIIKHKGEIDKLMGDCIMALFHNPDDALKSAIDIRMELDRFNAVINCHSERSEESSINEVSGFFTPLRSVQNDKILRPLDNGIGLNYGEVIIGNIGSESKMDYTVVGDIVNTASRLEALTKYYKVPLIISEDLKVQLKDNYNIRFLDEALVKGKSTPVKIYEVYDFESDENKKTRERNEKPLREAFALYQQGEFLKAISLYEGIGYGVSGLGYRGSGIGDSDSYTQNPIPYTLIDPVLPFFIERCKNLQLRKEAGLLKEWNGVFEFMDK